MTRLIPPILNWKSQETENHVLGMGYKLSAGQGQYGLDTLFSDSLDIDENKMSVVIPFADGNRRDGVGDLLEVEGIHTDRHRANPICLFDHGKNVQLPIGLAEDPKTKQYTVVIDPISKTAYAKAFFYQGGKGLVDQERDDPYDRVEAYDHAVFCEQLFDLIAKRYVRAGSIGYQVIQASPLEVDYRRGTPKGLHLLETLLLEVSAVVLPANSDTVRKMLAMPDVCGKPLSPYLIKSLQPYVVNKKTQVGFGSYLGQTKPRQTKPHHTPPDRTIPDLTRPYRTEGGQGSSYGIEAETSMKISEKSFQDDLAKITAILRGRELTINQIGVEMNLTPRDIRSRLDELIRTEVVRKRFIYGDDVYFLAENSKSLRLKYRKGGEEMKTETKEMDEKKETKEAEPKTEVDDNETMDGEPREEMYGAQVLRAFHRDHLAIMQDYDAMIGPLENPKVRKMVEKKIMQVDKDLTECEAIFASEYPDYEPLTKDDEAVEADSGEEALPSPEQVAEGMATKELDEKATKDLRAKYKTKPEDDWKRCGRYERCKKEMCPKCGKEDCGCSASKDMAEEVEEVRGDLEETGEELEDVEEMQPYEKAHIKNAFNFLTHAMGSQDWTDDHRMEAYHHGKNLLSMAGVHQDLSMVPPGTHVPPAVWKPGAGAIKGMPSDDISPEKARAILHDGEVNGKPLTDDQRRMFGAAASRGEKSIEGDDAKAFSDESMEPQHSMNIGANWRKMCKGAGEYMMELSKTHIMTDMHRTKGMSWHKQMSMYSNDEMEAGAAGPEQGSDAMDAAKGLKATFTKQGEMLANLLKKLAILGAA